MFGARAVQFGLSALLVGNGPLGNRELMCLFGCIWTLGQCQERLHAASSAREGQCREILLEKELLRDRGQRKAGEREPGRLDNTTSTVLSGDLA